MTVLCDNQRCFFKERMTVSAQGLVLSFPFDCDLLINGENVGKGQNGRFCIPHDKLRMGENTLHIRLPGKVLPCESLYCEKTGVKPMGLPTEELLLSVFLLLQQTKDAVKNLEARIAHAEKDLRGASLF